MCWDCHGLSETLRDRPQLREANQLCPQLIKPMTPSTESLVTFAATLRFDTIP